MNVTRSKFAGDVDRPKDPFFSRRSKAPANVRFPLPREGARNNDVLCRILHGLYRTNDNVLLKNSIARDLGKNKISRSKEYCNEKIRCAISATKMSDGSA